MQQQMLQTNLTTGVTSSIPTTIREIPTLEVRDEAEEEMGHQSHHAKSVANVITLQ